MVLTTGVKLSGDEASANGGMDETTELARLIPPKSDEPSMLSGRESMGENASRGLTSSPSVRGSSVKEEDIWWFLVV